MNINFFNETKDNIDEYIELINHIFEKIDDKEFNIIFVDNNKIQEINKLYRNIDKVTDVISFATIDDDALDIGADSSLGDIFICLERAYLQSIDYGHSMNREVGFLAVHGYLHLSGYDHMNSDDERVMIEKQNEILNNANIKRTDNND